jgi:hypothetical protein
MRLSDECFIYRQLSILSACPVTLAKAARGLIFCLPRPGVARFKLAVTLAADLSGLSNAELRQLLLEQQQLLPKALSKVAEQKRLVAELRDEVARLKGLKGWPPIKPSGMDPGTTPKPRDKRGGRRGRGKTTARVRVEDQVVPAEVPPGSRSKGYEDFVVQDLVLRSWTIRYRRERWISPDGRTVIAPLPSGIRATSGRSCGVSCAIPPRPGHGASPGAAVPRDRDRYFEAAGDAAAT